MKSINKAQWMPVQGYSKSNKNQIVDRLVRRFSAGNVCLQMGWYTTSSEVDELRQKVLSHDYRNPKRTR